MVRDFRGAYSESPAIRSAFRYLEKIVWPKWPDTVFQVRKPHTITSSGQSRKRLTVFICVPRTTPGAPGAASKRS